MSYRAEAWALDADHPQMKATQKWLLMILAHCHNDETDACFPGMDYLVRRSMLSRATVKRHLVDLENQGFIVRHIGGGRRRSNYLLFGVPRPRMAVERVEDGYTHPAQDEPAEGSLLEPGEMLDRAQDEPSPRASCEPAGGSSSEPRIVIEQEDTKPRWASADVPVDTRIPEPDRAMGLARIEQLRAQLNARSATRPHALEGEGTQQPAQEIEQPTLEGEHHRISHLRVLEGGAG